MNCFRYKVEGQPLLSKDLVSLIEIKGGTILKVSEKTYSFITSSLYYKTIEIKSQGMTQTSYSDIFKLYDGKIWKIQKIEKHQKGFCKSDSTDDIIETYKIRLTL